MAQIQFRRDTAANWTLYNSKLAEGELGYETDTGLFKIGRDGTGWNSLPYYYGLSSTRFSNITTSITTTGSSSWTVPAALQVLGMTWRVTLVGGGGAGGTTGATAGQVGCGGGSGAVVQGIYSYALGQNTMGVFVAAASAGAGATTTTTYNSVTFTAGGGGAGNGIVNDGGGAGGTASGGSVNINGNKGDSGGTMAAGVIYRGAGADTPLGFGVGGTPPGATGAGNPGGSYGGGGAGGNNKATATARSGGSGSQGIIIIEY